MNKKLIALLIGGIAAGALSSNAQTATTTPAPAAPAAAPAPAAPAAPSLSITVTPTFASQYMFRGQRLGGPAFEPSVEADYGNWAVGVWANTPLADKVVGQSDPEIDPYGSYTYSVNDNLSIVPGFTWYTYLKAPTNQGFYRETFEPNLAVNYTIAGVKLTPKIYYDLVLQGPTYEFDAAYTVPLPSISSELDFSGTAGTYLLSNAVNQSTPDTKAWGNYWLVGVSAPFAVSKNGKVSVGWAYTKGSDAYFKQKGYAKSVNTGAVGRGVLTVSYAYTF